jgi:hypothetical protein
MTDIETIREKWRIEGFDCTLWEDPPDKVWSDLADPRDERVLVLSGVLQVESEGFYSGQCETWFARAFD